MENKKKLNLVIDEWLQFKKIAVKESTYYRYLYIVNQYIIPYFEDIDLKELEQYNFNDFIENLLKILKPVSAKNVITILKYILNYAERKYDYRFHLDLVAIPKIHKEELRVLSIKEKLKLEKYCLKNNTLRDIGILVCLNTGLRIGEICALKWNCIDLERHCIRVKETMQRVYNKEENRSKVIIDVPKSQTSIRIIPISTKIYNILKPLKKQYSRNSYFLTGSIEEYIEPRNYQFMFKRCLDNCNIKEFHFHQLRHTFATDCVRVGMDTKSLSEVLGHSNVSITLEKYVHSSFNSKKKFLEKL